MKGQGCMQANKIGCMDNFRRGLHTYLGAGAETSLGVCFSELKR
jgi:hypothetical protein